MTHAGKCEVADLTAVHELYGGLLEQALGHPIPTPAGLEDAAAEVNLRHWLNLLELAVSPAMVRQGLWRARGADTAEALLRFYVSKPVHAGGDYEKTDSLVAFLYRQLMAGVTATTSLELIARFEAQIMRILGYQESPPLPNEHRQLAHEFEFIREESEKARHFDELMGVLQRVRDIKARFGQSFYHPRVLATVGEHNVYFGQRFDERFREAVRQIREFAGQVQQQGGSISSRVDEEITVQHLTEVEDKGLLQQEYERARPHFQRISRYEKAVGRRANQAPPPAVEHEARPVVSAAAMPVEARSLEVTTLAETPPSAVMSAAEETKLRGMEGSIRNFVRAAEPKSAQTVPMRGSNLQLSPAEVECFRVDHGMEKSFRADYTALLRHMVAVQGRVMTELQAFDEKQESAYLWKPHADSLAWLIANGPATVKRAEAVTAVAQQRGLGDKVASIGASLQKMQAELQRAAKRLEAMPQSNL